MHFLNSFILCVFMGSMAWANNNDAYVNFDTAYSQASLKYGSNVCQVCHNGTPPALNSFGTAYLQGGRTIAALNNLRGTDTDNDTYSNLAEINAGSFPADMSSDPTNVNTTSGGSGSSTSASRGPNSTYDMDVKNENMLATTSCATVGGAGGSSSGSGGATGTLLLPIAILLFLRTRLRFIQA